MTVFAAVARLQLPQCLPWWSHRDCGGEGTLSNAQREGDSDQSRAAGTWFCLRVLEDPRRIFYTDCRTKYLSREEGSSLHYLHFDPHTDRSCSRFAWRNRTFESVRRDGSSRGAMPCVSSGSPCWRSGEWPELPINRGSRWMTLLGCRAG